MKRKQTWFEQDIQKMRNTFITQFGYHQLCLDAAQAGVEGVDLPVVRNRCAKCDTPMVERNGKFGRFLACPKGTIDDKHPTQKYPSDVRGTHLEVNVRSIVQYSKPYYQPSLSEMVNAQMVAFGLPAHTAIGGMSVGEEVELAWTKTRTEEDDPDFLDDWVRDEYGG